MRVTVWLCGLLLCLDFSCVLIFRLKEHVEDPNKLPILIFPEGTCINNTSVMQFKKGSFEVMNHVKDRLKLSIIRLQILR